LAMPEIAWAGLQIDGVNVTMKIVEAVPVPPMEDMSEPRDIIARRDGLIERMIVLEGVPQVKEGDYVAKGQLLVSGTIYHEMNDITRHVHAMAQVWIRTYYTDECLIPPLESGLIPTGETAEIVYLTHNEKEHRLFGKAPAYHLSSIEETAIGPALFGWQLNMRRYHEMEREKQDPAEWARTLREAEKETYRRALSKIPAGVKVIDKTTRYDMIKDGGVRLSVWVQVMEDIALPVNTGG
jgi:similar to stage IV sporulation protein